MPDEQDNHSPEVLAAKADSALLGELFAKYRPFLRIVADQQIDKRLSPRCDGSDIAQEVLKRAFENFASFRGNSDPELIAWLSEILTNVVKEFVRRHIVTKKRSLNNEERLYGVDGTASFYWYDLSVDDSHIDKSLIEGERALRIAAAVDSLNRNHYEVIQLYYFEGLKTQEIADTLGITRIAVAGRIKRALKALHDALQGDSLL